MSTARKTFEKVKVVIYVGGGHLPNPQEHGNEMKSMIDSSKCLVLFSKVSCMSPRE